MLNTSQKIFLKSVNRQLFNPTTIKHHRFDCHIATAKQCGTHWIKYMLSLVLCQIHDLPLPAHIMEDSVVGHPRTAAKYTHIPQIAVTHSHPHYLLHIPSVIDVLHLPRYLVMVRDPRDILVSAYEKAKGEYLSKVLDVPHEVEFSEFLRASMDIKKPFADIWSIILFFNDWGPVLSRHPNKTNFVRYEDMKADTAAQMHRICDFIGIAGATEAVIAAAIENSSRDKMKKKLNPDEDQKEKSVNLKIRNFKEWYSPQDRQFVDDIFTKHLKYDYGYNLQDWD